MSPLETLEQLLTPRAESFLNSLFVDDAIDFYTGNQGSDIIPIIKKREFTLKEPENLPYIRKFTKDNLEDLKKEMIINRTGIIVQYIRSEKNEIRLLSLYLRLRDSV